MYHLRAVTALGKHIDPLAAAIMGIGAKFQKSLLLKPHQQPGNRWVGQMESLFNIPGTGRLFLMGKKAQNMSLRGSQIHLCQRMGDGLIQLTVQNLEIERVSI